eukprot:1617390-Amphidinium_carterae.1
MKRRKGDTRNNNCAFPSLCNWLETEELKDKRLAGDLGPFGEVEDPGFWNALCTAQLSRGRARACARACGAQLCRRDHPSLLPPMASPPEVTNASSHHALLQKLHIQLPFKHFEGATISQELPFQARDEMNIVE